MLLSLPSLSVKVVVLALLGAVVSALAFPPYGPGVLILVGVILFLWSLRIASTPSQGLLAGAIYGLVFFGWLMSWLAELDALALVLIPVQAAFPAMYGWWLSRYHALSSGRWLMMAVSGWALMELVRYHFPVGGLEWGAVGYALSDNPWSRFPARAIGTSGLTLLVVALCAVAASALARRWDHRLNHVWWAVAAVAVLLTPSLITHYDGPETTVAIVQGSTPCPFEHCPPDERLRTYEQHLELTRTIEPGTVDLVVWSEGSTGSTNADPVLNQEIREKIAAEARRIGAPMLVGGDRIVSETEWVNANVYFDANGEIVGEYRKQHPVPFGEYIPFRAVFGRIPALDRVPRDMIPGEGPVIFDGHLGSVISFEGGFSRYALENRRAGAGVIVVATNEASYGPYAATSDQFIGMTRMRAVELGVPVVHAAVTGKSTVISPSGDLGEITGLGTQEVLIGVFGPGGPSVYRFIGDWPMILSALAAVILWWRARALVGSAHGEEE